VLPFVPERADENRREIARQRLEGRTKADLMPPSASDDGSSRRPFSRPQRALQPSTGRVPGKPANRWLPVAARRALPALTRSAAGLAVGFAANYAIRSLARRAVSDVAPLPGPAAAPPAGRQFTRHVVTEIMIVERPGRRR
jgi:hypothetical protein